MRYRCSKQRSPATSSDEDNALMCHQWALSRHAVARTPHLAAPLISACGYRHGIIKQIDWVPAVIALRAKCSRRHHQHWIRDANPCKMHCHQWVQCNVWLVIQYNQSLVIEGGDGVLCWESAFATKLRIVGSL